MVSVTTSKYIYKFLLSVCFSTVIIFTDINTGILEQIRMLGQSLVYPIETVAKLPIQAVRWFEENTKDENTLLQENNELILKIYELETQVLQIDSLRKENKYLNRVLETSKSYKNWKLQTAKVIHIPNSAFHRWIDIDKGYNHNVRKGNTVLFDNMLIGQISQVSANNARVILIFDPEHQTPIENQRTGLSGILQGNSDYVLPVKFMRNFSDIKVDDILVTSGRGNVFPKNIPVAKVENVEFLQGHNFAIVNASRIVDISILNYVVVLSHENL